MDYALLAFLAFAVVTVVAAGAVISVRSPVHAALCLVLTFFTVACTWILADAEFLGIALVVVYVGAVMVLFMFVVMMLDIDEVKMHEGYVRYLPLGLLVAVVMLAEILMLIGIKARATPFGADPALAAGVPNIEWLRSEEHKSELQSLMRISYAVFCLKQKCIKRINYNRTKHLICTYCLSTLKQN